MIQANFSVNCNCSQNIFFLSELCLNSSSWSNECVLNLPQLDNCDTKLESDDTSTNLTINLRIATGIWSIFIGVFGVLGNLLTLYALPHAKKCKEERDRWKRTWNTSTVFILNLARIDLFFCIFCIPSFAIPFITQSWKYGHLPCHCKQFEQ